MDEMLADCSGTYWYLDDIIIEGKNVDEHDSRLEKVLSKLKDRGVELKWEKCLLRVTKLEFLGHKISEQGISPSDSKIAALMSFRAPQNEAEVRSFLGLANYLNKFIPHLATIDEPLRRLLIKGAKFEWSSKESDSFQSIKNALSNMNILGFYRVEDRSAVIADASPYGLGAILLQFNDKNVQRVISFASKSLTETERRYCQTEKEALAVVWSVERFQYYLLGKKFDILTDCKVLELLFSKRSRPCARIERWVLRLQTFDYNIIHVSGKENIADSLSRLAVQDPEPFDPAEEIFVREIAVQAANCAALTWNEIVQATEADGEICKVIDILQKGDMQNLPVEYRVVANELCNFQGVLLRSDRIVIPGSLRDKVLTTAHEGHPGIVMMKSHLRSNVWWPKMDQAVERFVKRCRGCVLVSAPEPPEPMNRSRLPSSPWQTVALDFLGPLPEGQHLLVVVDCYSRYMEIIEMDSTTTHDVIRELMIMFSRYGIPSFLKADNAPQISAECVEFRDFCLTNGIKLLNTIPYWPQSNGEVERQNRSILKRLRISQELGKDWRNELRQYLLTYHSSKHPTTGKSPGELMFGRQIKSKLPTISNFLEDDGVRERDAMIKEKGKEYSDKRRQAKERDIQQGDIVLAKRMRKANKLDTDFANEEFVVQRKEGTDTLIQSKVTGKQYRRSSAHLKKVQAEETFQETQGDFEPVPAAAPSAAERKPDADNGWAEATSTCRSPSTRRPRNVPMKYQDYVPY